MILINALVCLVSLVLICLLIRPHGAPSFLIHLLFVIPIVSMLSSAGVLYDIQWAMQVS